MNIIFGSEAAEAVGKTNVVLEVDTIRLMPVNVVLRSFCVLENVALSELANLEYWKQIHNDLLAQYQVQNWDYCVNAIQDLRGRWNGELDEFYDNLLKRIRKYQAHPPEPGWDHALTRDVEIS